MAQIVRTFDKELYKTYVFTEFLYKFLPKNPHEKVNLDDKIALKYNQLKETFSGTIELNPTIKDKTIKGEKPTEGQNPKHEKTCLKTLLIR